jgi:ABC-type polysaccharide/polyol phosphate export permease/predicted Zn-dependent protease
MRRYGRGPDRRRGTSRRSPCQGRRPGAGDFARQRAAASALAACRRFEAAIPFAQAARDLAPDDPHCAFHLAALWNEIGLHAQATQPLLQIVKDDPTFVEAFHHLAYAASKLGYSNHAADLAAHAAALDPANTNRAMFAAHMLAQVERFDEAIALLRGLALRGADTAQSHRALSAFLFQAGRPDAALEAIDAALRLVPEHSEYLVHRATVLSAMGEHADAARCLDAALARDPDNLPARRHAVTLYAQGGHFDQAVASTAELLRRAPDNPDYANCMLHVLSLRTEIASALPDITARKRRAPPRPPKPRPTLARAFRIQARVIAALLLREMRTRFGESRLGYLWVLVEIMIHLGFLAVVFQFFMHGQPPMGRSFFFFYFTGLTPYILFIHTSEHAGTSIIQNQHMLQLPMVTHVDVVLSRALLELFTQAVVTILFCAGFIAAGVDAIPRDMGQALLALATVWLLGLGFGMINAVVNSFFHFWHHVFSIITRFLYFCSGIFYVPGIMPVGIRDILAWNPLLHCVDWLRTCFFPEYHPQWLARAYPALFGSCLLLAGLALEAVSRRKLRRLR